MTDSKQHNRIERELERESLNDRFSDALYQTLAWKPEIERLIKELDAVRARKSVAGEVVVLRWERSMELRDFLDLILDSRALLMALSNGLAQMAREDLERARRAGSSTDAEQDKGGN
jgi:hypothetical protein